MPIDFSLLSKQVQRSHETFMAVNSLAERLREHLDDPSIQARIMEVHQVGASSAAIQKILEVGVTNLGFQSEKKGLFSNYSVPALRPDYFAEVGTSGILLEVERGKTTTNNMDLLDLWKCHICPKADYLFLVVPKARQSKRGSVMRHFKQAQNRLGTFFIPSNYVNVEAVFLFGY